MVDSDSRVKTLRAIDFGPNSIHYLGLPWMAQIQQTINKGTIISARDLKSNGTLNNDDKILYDRGFKKATSALGKTETVVLKGESHKIVTAPTLPTPVDSIALDGKTTI